MTIFQTESHLHDGAVIMQSGSRLPACFLPLTVNPRLSRELGSRHPLPAIGLTEENDSVAVVVSEEPGDLARARRRHRTRLTPDDLRRLGSSSSGVNERAQIRFPSAKLMGSCSATSD